MLVIWLSWCDVEGDEALFEADADDQDAPKVYSACGSKDHSPKLLTRIDKSSEVDVCAASLVFLYIIHNLHTMLDARCRNCVDKTSVEAGDELVQVSNIEPLVLEEQFISKS